MERHKHAITETPKARSKKASTEDERAAKVNVKDVRLKHSGLGIASCVMLALSAPFAIILIGMAAWICLILFSQNPGARVVLIIPAPVAAIMLFLTFPLSFVGMLLGIAGLTEVNRLRRTAIFGLLFHAATFVESVAIVILLQRC